MGHQPALDGIRGLAVLAVLVLHAGAPSWLPGGFLGVSLFFTLSGHLIASLVLAEVEHRGGLGLSGFWARRVRRLVPALIITVIGVATLSRLMELPASTRSELLGGLGYVANWVQISGGESYAALFESPSAATHLWSLAIEEQFYLVFPFAAWLVARRSRFGLRSGLVVGGLVVAVVGSLAAAAIEDQVFTYYSTLTRVPEIAVGVAVAGIWPMGRARTWWDERFGGDRTHSPVAKRHPPWLPVIVANVVGIAALVTTLVAWRTTDLSTGWVYGGGLVVLAIVSVALVVAAGAPGLLSRGLSVAPLRGLGAISYGLYLYHWPVVVVASPPRVDLRPVPLFVLRAGLSVGLAMLSFRFVEQPIRHARWERGASPAKVITVGLVSLALTGLVVIGVVDGAGTPEPVVRPAPAVVRPGTPDTGDLANGDEVSPSDVPTVVLLGDSLPNWLIRDGGWALDPAEVSLIDGTNEGCDGAEGAPVGRAGTGVVVTLPDSCTGWRSMYPQVLDGRPVDVAVLAIGAGAVLDRQLDGEFVGPCQAEAQDWYGTDVVQRLEFLSARSDRVVLLLPVWGEEGSGWVYPSDHLARMDCVRATMLRSARSVPGVDVLDLAEEICPDGPGMCQPVRKNDGVHIDSDSAAEVLGWIIDLAVG